MSKLVRLILPAPSADVAADFPQDLDHEFRQVSEAVLRECIVNLGAHQRGGFDPPCRKPNEFFPARPGQRTRSYLRGITAGLLMLGKGRRGGN